MHKSLCILTLSLSLLLVTVGIAGANSPVPLVVEYPLPGSPMQVAVESPGRIWATEPAENAIVRLIVTSTTDYNVTTYSVPTANAEPYDIRYANGMVWFTERTGNKIGRLDPSVGTFVECTIPTANSQPTGIAVLAAAPVKVWFTERNGNQLGTLDGDNLSSCNFVEYVLPSSIPGAQPESIYIEDANAIWFTAPSVSNIGRLRPSLYPSASAYAFVPTGSGTRPWAIYLDDRFAPWFTDRAGRQVGKYFPGTLSLIHWYLLSDATATTFDIVSANGLLWFTESNANRIGQLDPVSGAIREAGLGANSAPMGIASDANGTFWVAESGRNALANWGPPYFRLSYLPFVSQ